MPSLDALEGYRRAVLRRLVAHTCRALGWQSASSSALDVLADVTHHQLQQLARATAVYANQFGRTEANLDDAGLALRELGVSAAELEEHAAAGELPPLSAGLPRLPVLRQTNLRFLKPGSQEIVTRPIHVYEHLPPMHPDTAEDEAEVPAVESPVSARVPAPTPLPALKRPSDALLPATDAKKPRYTPEEEGRPMREILSVMMTTSGFISPAREGKLPETRMPDQLDDYGEDYRNVKTRKQRADTYRRLSERENERRAKKDRWGKSVDEDDHDLFDIIDVKVEEEEPASSPEKLPAGRDTAKLKPFKKQKPVSDVAVKAEPPPQPSSPPKVKQEPDEKAEKPRVKPKQTDGKSSKLSIFKKIAKVKQEKAVANAEKPGPIKGTNATIGRKKLKKKPPRVLGPELFKADKVVKSTANKASKSTPAKAAAAVQVKSEPGTTKPPPKTTEKSKPGARSTAKTSKSADVKSSGRAARSPSPPVPSASSMTPPGTPGTPRMAEARRKPSELSLGELSPRSYDSGTPDRPRTPELPLARRESPPPPPDPAVLLNNPLIPRFPFPFSAGGVEGAVPTPPFPGLAGLRPPPSLFAGGGGPAAASPPAERSQSRGSGGGPARALDPRRSPGDDSDGSRSASPGPDVAGMTPLKRLELEERAEKKREKEHKKNKKDKKDKKKKDKKDKEKKEVKAEKREVKTEKKEKKKIKEEKIKLEGRAEEAVPKLTLRLGASTSSHEPAAALPSPSPPPPPAPPPDKSPPKVTIKPVRQQSAATGRGRKEKKAAEVPAPAPPPPAPTAAPFLKPPKKEKKKSPQPKSKKTVAKQPAAAVIAETVGSFLDEDGNRIWICPECGRQDDGSPMIGCDQCDDWYHWVCVGIQVPPANNEDWFCPRCIGKMQESVKQKGRGRGRRKT